MLSSIHARILLFCAALMTSVDSDTNPGVHRAKQLLLQWKVTLDNTDVIVNEITKRFILTGDLELGRIAIFLRKKYINEEFMWSKSAKLLTSSNDTASRLLQEQYNHVAKEQNITSIIDDFNDLVTIYSIALLLNVTLENIDLTQNPTTHDLNQCESIYKELNGIELHSRNPYLAYFLYLLEGNNVTGNDYFTEKVTQFSPTVKLDLLLYQKANSNENNLLELHSICERFQNVTHNLSTSNASDNNVNNEYFTYSSNFIINKFLKEILEKLTEVWDRYSGSKTFPFPWPQYFQLLDKHYFNNTSEKIETIRKIFQYYVYPTVYFIVFVIGITGNGVLLLIFLKHETVRTASNIMLLNLAIADTTNLLLNAPLYYIMKYHCNLFSGNGNYFNYVYLIYRSLNNAQIELSILCLSAQRYFATSSALKSASGHCCRFSSRVRNLLYILTVWTIGVIMAFPPVLMFEFKPGQCYPTIGLGQEQTKFILDIIYCLFDALFLPVIIATFNILTARLLRRSVREIPGAVRNNAQLLARYRSANIVISLSIAFAVTYIPRSIWFFLFSVFHFNMHDLKSFLMDEITNYLMFTNSALNPIALYLASNTFRTLMNKYLFNCSSPRHKIIERTVSLDTNTTIVS